MSLLLRQGPPFLFIIPRKGSPLKEKTSQTTLKDKQLPQMVLGHLGTHMQENDMDPYLTPHTTQTLLHKLKQTLRKKQRRE